MKIDSILILAAGRGERLKPYTNNLPKSLLPLQDTNILRNLIMQLNKYFMGIRIYINTSYLAEKIINEVTNFPVNIRPLIIWEQIPLGPAFTVSNHCNTTHENVLVIHGDNFFSDSTFSELANRINQKTQDSSILLCHQRSKEAARSIIIEEEGTIKSISEADIKGVPSNFGENRNSELAWSSSGVIVIKRNSLVNFTPKRGEGLSPNLINYIASNEVLHLEKCTGTRISIDSEKSYFVAIEASKNSQKLFKRAF